MIIRDKVKRAIAFYLSVALFCVLLPIVLSYSLGYKIDYHKLKIYKTGILYIESRPAGAFIYVNGKKHSDLTPAQIEELRPGVYRVEVRREGFYPWERQMTVRPNMVTRADRIVLFPVVREMKKLGERGVSDFAISTKGQIYYMKKSGFYRSNMDGSAIRRLSAYSDWPERIEGKKFSPDDSKLLYYTDTNAWVIYLENGKAAGKNGDDVRVQEVFSGNEPIIDAFWYPGAGYILVVTCRNIMVAELHGGSGSVRNIVTLYKFNAAPQGLYFDESSGSLYFTDTGFEGDSRQPRYLYRIDLKEKFFEQMLKILFKKEPEN